MGENTSFDRDGETQFLTNGKWFGMCATFLASFSVACLKYIFKKTSWGCFGRQNERINQQHTFTRLALPYVQL